MKKNEDQFTTSRRDMLKYIGLGSAAMLMGNFGFIPSVDKFEGLAQPCLLYTSPSPRDRTRSRMPSSA